MDKQTEYVMEQKFSGHNKDQIKRYNEKVKSRNL